MIKILELFKRNPLMLLIVLRTGLKAVLSQYKYSSISPAILSNATHQSTQSPKHFYSYTSLKMQFTKTFFTLATLLTVVSAAVTLQRRIADPENPANLVNCEPGGGADDCHLEQPVSHSSST